MVWCNAMTEWYNSKKGTSYECVYTYSGVVIRDSRETNSTACINANAKSTAKGFRLPTLNEWELAARYRNGTLWTYGDHASGDDSGACWDDGSILGGLGISTVFGNYAVYQASSSAEVKTKRANSIGLYDMSGNVWEFCFPLNNLDSNLCYIRGGGWNGIDEYLRIGSFYSHPRITPVQDIGFRLTRTH